MTEPKSTKTYVVRLEQLNRIDPETKDFAPLNRGDELDLDPTSADAKRLLAANAIGEKPADVPAQVAIDPASSAHPEDLEPATPADGGSHAAPLAPEQPAAGSQPAAVSTDADTAGQGTAVS